MFFLFAFYRKYCLVCFSKVKVKDVNVHSYNMSGGSKKVHNLLVVNDLWFQHPLLEERQQNLRVFTVEIYRREEIQKKRCRKNTL